MFNRHSNKPSDHQELSSTYVDNKNPDDFLIDICRIIKNSQEYDDILKEDNTDTLSEEQKMIRKLNNVFELKQFLAQNLETILNNRVLLEDILKKLTFFKKIIKDPQSTEYATAILLELKIKSLLNK